MFFLILGGGFIFCVVFGYVFFIFLVLGRGVRGGVVVLSVVVGGIDLCGFDGVKSEGVIVLEEGVED